MRFSLLGVIPLIIHLSLWVCAQASSTPQALDRESERNFDRGVQFQQQGDLQNARLAYEAALKAAPRRVDALSNLGSVLAQLNDYDKAIQQYRKALAVNPALYQVRYHLGAAYFRTQRFELAEQEFQRVVKARPADFQARQLLGLSFLRQNKLPEGIAELENVCSAQRENLDAAYTLASAYISNQQLDKADGFISRALAGQSSAEASLIRGSYQIAVKKYLKAAEELTRAKKLNPKLPSVHSQLGYAQLCTGNTGLAIQEFQAELVDNPLDFNSNACLSWIYRENGRVEESAVLLKRALEVKPDDTGMLFQLASLTQAQGRKEEAVQVLERVVKQKPDYTPAHVLLARLYFQLNRMSDARREREIINRLNLEEQSRQPSAADQQDRYTGVTVPPR
jgi:tetratricopeptide (TPR) repeat protein